MWKYLLVLLSLITHCTSPTQSELVWQDEFDGDMLDTTKWTPVIGDGCPGLCGFGNNELQYYDVANASLADGILTIEARKESKGTREYTSAKLITRNKGDWQYGKVVVRARLPYGKGTWPAIWMLPTIKGRKMKWPLDGEIDIMEHVGYNQGTVYGTIHTDRYNGAKGTQKTDSVAVADAHTAFHDYAVTWDHQVMTWAVDGTEYFRLERETRDYQEWPFDQKYHLILNVAVGGNWGGKFGVDDSIWPQTMEIDYVRIYQ